MDDAEFSSINITPLVDIVLVLLIIALTGTIASHHALVFDAPGGGADQVLVLDVGRDGWRLDGAVIEGNVLETLVKARTAGAEALLLRVDPTLDLSVAVRAADLATAAGFHRLGMISRPPAMTP